MEVKDMKIFQPIQINKMVVKNRIASAPFGGIPAADVEGYICEESIKSVRELVESGIGMLTLGIITCMPVKIEIDAGNYDTADKKKFGAASLNDDKYIPSWKLLVDYCHGFDCKLGVQLYEWGPQALNQLSDMPKDYQKYACYSLGGTDTMPPMKTLSVEDLNNVVENVAQAALRAKKAGLDYVEIHAAHSSALLYATSLDPFFNNRDDEYGGDFDRRSQLCFRTIRRMRELVGPDFPILIRINGDDLKGELGNTSEDVCKYIVPMLEEAGVDAIDISQGGPMYTTQGPLPPLYYPRGCWMHLSGAVKKVANVPVIGAGRITTVEMAEKYLREDFVDVLYFGRQLYSDGNIIHNYVEGKKNSCDNRECIGCLMACTPCSINYAREDIKQADYDAGNLEPVKQPKKVLVIGGGVAGMEAARVAKIKGHDVTLWEKEGILGGTVATLATTPLLAEFQNVVDYLAGQMRALEVDVRCCCEATMDKIKELAPDAVILATGADFKMPENVAGQPMVMTHLEAMRRKREFRSLGQWHKKVVIYGFTAAEFAIDLAEAGADVVLMGGGGEKSLAAEGYISRERKVFIRRKLTDTNYIRRTEEEYRMYNPVLLTHTKLEGVSEKGVHYYHNGIHKTMPYDVLIISGGKKKNDELLEEIKTNIPETYAIGDCARLGNIHLAIKTANEVARHL